MKKIILTGLAFLGAIALTISIYSYTPPPAPVDLAAPGGAFTLGSFPLYYTAVDTVINGASVNVDSFKAPFRRGWATNYSTSTLNSITFSCAVWKVAGSPTVTVAVYGSANNGISYASTPLATAVVLTPTNLVTPLTTNLVVQGNPYTDYVVATSGTISSTYSNKSWVTIR